MIDEARTPLIISAPAQEATQQYFDFARLVATLQPETDFIVDEKQHSATLTEAGIAKVEQSLGIENLYVEGGMRTVHHIEQALKARTLFQKDKEYVVRDGEIIIVDEFTGRLMEGRRYSAGLHQAIEAKENVSIQQESRTLATITLQNYFRMYEKLSGMTGTAETEAEEFFKIYGLDVVVVPTHRDIARVDASDRIYKNAVGKYKAVIEEVRQRNANGQPVLIGTASIEQNELLSQLLSQANIAHGVLNAKNHEREAEIIAQAGKTGAVTVATNMAGRGVDIILGGNPVDIEEARKIKEAGGLVVIGTARHEARRIDNQLRGRAGRQGDPGHSQFFVSMEDDLMRIFGSDRMKNMMNALGVPDDMPVENKMVTRSIESAQKKVESRNFDIRKHLVEYDDVINKQRDTMYRLRNQILDGSPEDIKGKIQEVLSQEIEHIISFHSNGAEPEEQEWNIEAMCKEMNNVVRMNEAECMAQIDTLRTSEEGGKLQDAFVRTKIIDYFKEVVQKRYTEMLEKIADDEAVVRSERQLYLRAIDLLWIEHIDQMSFLRDSIGLRGYGQRDPLVEYKKESFSLFSELLVNLQRQVAHNVFSIGSAIEHARDHHGHQHQDEGVSLANAQYSAPEKEMQKQADRSNAAQPAVAENKDNEGNKVGRNDPCPCGSGKKYKKCHGA